MGGFFKNNPVDTVVGSTDATEDTINETAVTETDSTSSFYRGSPEQTTVDGYVADAAGHAATAAQHAEDAEDSEQSASYYNFLASQQLGLAQSAANEAEGYRDTALQHRNSANISVQGASQHAATASQKATEASGYADDAADTVDTVYNYKDAAEIAASAALQSATSASNSANSILNLTVASGAVGSSPSYDASTGVLTIPRGNRGAGFTGGSYNDTTGIVTFSSNDGLGFSTSDLRTIEIDAGTF